MDLSFTPDEARFREEVRSFIRDNLPASTREHMRNGSMPEHAEITQWQRILNRRGWGAPSWPTEYGGPGWSAVQRLIFMSELFAAPAPEPYVFNVNMVGPLIIHFGSQEQKRTFLPKLVNMDVSFCIGMSEPGAGSDLASLRTSARLEGDNYIVNGQKIWTTFGHNADWMYCMVRTDSAAKHRGISVLLIDMRSPGLTVRPIISLDRRHHFNEVFFDNVAVPRANLVGEENRGWDYGKFLLSLERYGQARVGVARERLAHARRVASARSEGGRTFLENERFRERLAAVEAELRALEITQYRLMLARDEGAKASPISSILKIVGTEMLKESSELAVEAGGRAALEIGGAADGVDWAKELVPNYFNSRAASIYGGTNEIQRNILSHNLLRLS
jgi:alkylation response protein AidB-like acyl-CoA dehydrogenase